MNLNAIIIIRSVILVSCIIIFNNPLWSQFSSSEWRLLGVNHNNDVLDDSTAIFYLNSLQGIISINGDTLVKPKYRNIKKMKNGFYGTFSNNFEKGIINREYKEILTPKHTNITLLAQGIQVIDSSKILYYDYEGNEKKDTFFTKYFITHSENGLLIASENQKDYGVIDEITKTWILKPKYHRIDISNPNFILTSNKDDNQVFSAKSKELLNKSKQKIIVWGSNFLIRDTENSPYFIYNSNGKRFDKIPKMYGNVYCEDNLYQVSKFYRVLYDTNFNLICEGEKVSKLNEKPLGHKTSNYHTEEKDQKLALLIDYKRVTQYKYSKIETADSIMIAVHSAGIDILDKDGKTIKFFSPNITFLSGKKLFHVKTAEKDSIYSFDSNQYIPTIQFKEIYNKGGLLAIKKEKNWDILDRNGKIIIQDAESVENGDLNAKGFVYSKNNLKGWCSTTGFLEVEFDQIRPLKNELLAALKNNEWKLFYNNGKPYSSLNISKIEEFEFGIICTTNDKTYVLVDGQREFIECQDFQLISEKYILIKNDNKWRFYDKTSEPINNKHYVTININNNIIGTDHEYYVRNNNNNELKSYDFDTMYYQSNILIGKKDDSTSIFTSLAGFKSYLCDSVGSINSFAAIYRNGKISLLELIYGDTMVQNADQIVHAENLQSEKFIIVRKSDQYEVYYGSKQVLTLSDPDIKIEIKSTVISYNLNGKRLIYDAIRDLSYVKKYDIYKLAFSGFYIVENNFKYGLVDNNHEEIIPCKYSEYFNIINNEYIEVRDTLKSAVYDIHGRLSIPLDNYDSNFTSNKNHIFAKKNNYYGYYDILAKKWHPTSKYQDIKDCNIRIDGIGDIFIFLEKGKYGLMNEQCNVVLSPEYESIELALNKFILTKNNKKSVIFVSSKMEKTSEYKNFIVTSFEDFWIGLKDQAFDLYNNNIFVKSFSGYDPVFLSYQYLSYKKGITEKNSVKEIFDLKNEKLLYSGKQNIVRILNGERLIIEENHGNYRLIDKVNNALFDQPIQEYKTIKGNMLWIKADGKQGVIDYNGKIVIEPKYEEDFSEKIYSFEKFLTIKNNQKIDIYDKSLTLIKSLDYDYMGAFSHNVAPIRKGSQWGFIDTSWNEVIPLIYDYCHSFYSPPITFVYKDKKLEFIDPQGKPTVNPKNLTVILNEMLGQIVASGNFNKENYAKLVCEEYYIKISDKLIFKDNETGKFGLMNPFYDIILPSSYDEIKRFETDFKYCFGYKLNEKWGIWDSTGYVIFEPTFERLEHDFLSKKLKVSINGHSSLIEFPDQ
jgi:hypothetical protein